MKSRVCLFMLLLSLTATILVYGQGPKKPRTEEDYVPRTLQELSTLQPEPLAQALKEQDNTELAILVHGDLLPSRVKVVYAGRARAINERKKSVIHGWANRFGGAPEFYTVPYQTEVLFTENDENYWLAVKQEFLSQIEELKKGDTVELFLIKMGNVRIQPADAKLEPVMLVEQYRKQ